ncbi:RagB/SusD family nutrient uptake outer membrane protein [Kordia jejudonensis]|uniref:RagB/SusD family nutrient uptake outer membrane protein n=1 Tax=Kordia jejudonensis TaxID=1348245 RepID=UPI0006292B06|nr:RagB/SusD family nutrient uptake outer membrane protein [Kordia jejudonensis]
MKNKYIHYIIIIIAYLSFSCEDYVDVEPLNTLSASSALNSSEKVIGALNGVYNTMSSTRLLGGDLIFVSELLGSDGKINFGGTFNDPRQIINKQILTTNSRVNNIFNTGYSTINQANLVLEAIDIVNDADRDSVEGEALFARALMHFELVKLFAKPYSDGNASSNLGIVLKTTASPFNGGDIADECNTRSTVQQVYDSVVTDLIRATALVPSSNGIYTNKATVNAVLARVYLQMGNYAGARDAANEAINEAGASLVPTYRFAFAQDANTSEDIFSIQVSEIDGTNGMNTFWAPSGQGGRGDVRITDGFIGFLTSQNRGVNANPNVAMIIGSYTTKWYNQFGNIQMVRLPELLLIRAEANLELGTAVGATPQQDLNTVRNRVGLPNITATVNSVLAERIAELAFEGQYLHDFKRRQFTIEGFAFDADELVFPIPQNQINACPDTQQNPGY